MKQEKDFDISTVEQWKIVIAITSNPGYEMNRILLVENHYNEYILIEGWHCSCYDFDDTSWDATFCNREELLKIIEGWGHIRYSAEYIARPIILRYLEQGG